MFRNFIQIDIKDTVFYADYYIYEIIRKQKFCSARSAFLHKTHDGLGIFPAIETTVL